MARVNARIWPALAYLCRTRSTAQGPNVDVTTIGNQTLQGRVRPNPSMDHFLKLLVFLKLTYTDPFAAWFVVTGDATPDGIALSDAEREGNNSKGLKDLFLTNGSSQVQDLVLTGLFMPHSLDSTGAECRRDIHRQRGERIFIELITSDRKLSRPERARNEGSTGPKGLCRFTM